jgi:hypothetical protein
MWASATASAKVRALCAGLVLALALASVVEALRHDPGVLAVEAEHRVLDAGHGHAHEAPGPGQQEAGDHEHIIAALPEAPAEAIHAPPDRALRPALSSLHGTIRDGPRRPPRQAMA